MPGGQVVTDRGQACTGRYLEMARSRVLRPFVRGGRCIRVVVPELPFAT